MTGDGGQVTAVASGHSPAHLAAEAFSTMGQRVSWGDVVGYARATGAWAAVEAETAEGAASLEADREAGRAPSASAVRAVAAAWRTRHRLTAAEDMEGWLERRELDVPGFFDHVRRMVARAAHRDAAELADRAPTGNDDQRARQTWTTAVCSGALDQAALDLAGHLAVRARLVDDGDATGSETLDEAMARFRSSRLTPEALHEELQARQLDWIRLGGDLLVFPTRPAADEARLCLLDDGRTPAELATATGAALHRQARYVDEAPVDDRPSLIAAQPGDVVGPLVHDSGWALLTVTARLLPSLDDADVRRRAEQTVLTRAIAHEVDDRVVWAGS